MGASQGSVILAVSTGSQGPESLQGPSGCSASPCSSCCHEGFAWSLGVHAAARQPALSSGGAPAAPVPSWDQPPCDRGRGQPCFPLLHLPRGCLARQVQCMELYLSPECSGREGTRPSPSYRFCCLLSEPAASIQEQTQQQNRPATVIYTA